MPRDLAVPPELTLAGEPASVRQARRYVREVFGALLEDDGLDVVVLLVSELVTNAVLHGAGEIRVRAVADERCARVEVADGSPALPQAREFARDAATGRGLHLVETCATRWGVRPNRHGKTVWFELARGGSQADVLEPPRQETRAAGTAAAVGDDEPEDALHPVVLVGVPVATWMRAVQHSEALLRELALIVEAQQAGESNVPARLLELVEQIRVRFSAFTKGPARQIVDAAARGETAVDLEYRLPVAARQPAADYAALLDEVDDYCRSGALLTLATPRDVLALRQWFFDEVVGQLSGRAPTPWPG